MSGEPEQEFFADGLTEDIITALSRFRDLFVISRNSAFVYKNRAVRIQEVAAEFGVQYVVEGSVRKAGNRVRVTVQLIDAESDRHVWAERYDRELEDIFAIQDEVTAAIVATLPGRVEAASHDRVKRKPTDNLAAYECVLAGKVLHHRSTRADNAEAQRVLERAIALDPKYAHAHAWLGLRARPGVDLRLVRRTATPPSGASPRSCRSRWRWTRTTATCTASSRRSIWCAAITSGRCTTRSGRSASIPTTT